MRKRSSVPTYKVLSGRLVGHEPGDTVTEDELVGANVAALVAAGHLAAVDAPTPDTSEED
jgi:hypothetical protein